MPDMPVAEAIASICMSIASKIGPSVSERSNSRSSAQSAWPDVIGHADPGAGVLAHVLDRLAEELEGQRHVRLVHVVHLRDNRRVRRAVGRTGRPSMPAPRCPAPGGAPRGSRPSSSCARLGIGRRRDSARRRLVLASARNTSWTSISTATLGAGMDGSQRRRPAAHRGRASGAPFAKRSRARLGDVDAPSGRTGRWLRYRPLI